MFTYLHFFLCSSFISFCFFAHRFNPNDVLTDLFDPEMESKKVLPPGVKEDLRIIVMKGHLILPIVPKLGPQHQMQFSIIPRTPLWIQEMESVYLEPHQKSYKTIEPTFHAINIWADPF